MGIILHIPHARTDIPEDHLGDYVMGPDELAEENRIMGDLYTDLLYPSDKYPSVIFPWSRLFVDVERFREDAEESMAGRGMGVLYERGNRLQRIRKRLSPPTREAILRKYYDPHHAELDRAVEAALEADGTALILDCHSFPAERLPYEDADTRPRPEICIGTDPFHTPEALSQQAVDAFRRLGFTVEVNYPFAGSITPLKHYRQTKAVRSLMIEVRRDLITQPASWRKSPLFSATRDKIATVIAQLGK